MALIIRKSATGEVRIEGDPPDEHEFTASWLARELESGLAELVLTVNTTAGPVTYRVLGFGANEDGTPNYTGVRAQRVEA